MSKNTEVTRCGDPSTCQRAERRHHLGQAAEVDADVVALQDPAAEGQRGQRAQPGQQQTGPEHPAGVDRRRLVQLAAAGRPGSG